MMAEEKSEQNQPKKKKLWSSIVTWVLGALILLLVVVDVFAIVSGNQSNNHGVPFLFGRGYLRVLTDSMAYDSTSGEVLADDLPVNTCAIIQKVDPSTLEDGDVITYYSATVSESMGTTMIISHRIKEHTTVSGKLVFYTIGDNLKAQTCGDTGCSYPANREAISEDDVIGKVIGHNDFLGGVLYVVQQQWFVPVAVLVPLTVIATLSAVDFLKEAKAEQKEEQDAIHAQLVAAGVDPKDEKAVILFEEKARYKYEIQKEMEKAKKEAKEELRSEIDKEKKRLKKEMKKSLKDGDNQGTMGGGK